MLEYKEDCIVLERVDKAFGDKKILKEIDLRIPYGKIYGLLGPSGCGKTTTVKIMAGISEASSGEAFVLGEKMPKLSVMNEIGYMAQSDALYSTLTAGENLAFFAAVYGLDKSRIKKRIQEVMAIVDLKDHISKPVEAYSGGMKRRLSLAMAILHEPKVLILDEPTVGIDPLLRMNIWDSLYEMALMGVTILVTTHVMDEALKCDELAMMRDGKIIAKGTPKSLQEDIGASSIEEAFIRYSSDPLTGESVESYDTCIRPTTHEREDDVKNADTGGLGDAPEHIGRERRRDVTDEGGRQE